MRDKADATDVERSAGRRGGAVPAAGRPFLLAHPASLIPLLMLLAFVHGLAYALVVPLWQAPDEPMLYEYAALVAELGRVPGPADRNPALEGRLLASLGRAGRWGEEPPPASLAELEARFNMPRQVGGDPPLAFALAGAALRLVPGWSVEDQARLLRVLNAALLPLAVLCTAIAARELLGAADRAAWLIAPAIVALQPMAAYTGAAVGNDALANALGALLCLLLLRAVAPERPAVPLAAFVLVAALALLVKRSALPYALLALLLGAGSACRGLAAVARRSRLRAGLLLAGALAVALAWSTSQLDGGGAAAWLDVRGGPAPRAEAPYGAAMLLRAGDEVIQPLPARATQALRNGALSFGARVWSDGPASGRLVVYTGERRQELPFSVEGGASVEISAYVPTIAPDVRLGVVADEGWFYAGQVWGRAAGLPGTIVANGDLGLPALREGSALHGVARYLRVGDLAWAAASGRPGQGIAPLDWASWIFVSFWGQFGWLDVPLVRGSLWAPALAVACALGLAGAVAAPLRRGASPGLRRRLLALLAVQALGLLALLINSVADPGPPPQGRYLLPLLAPLALTIAAGLAALAPARAARLWLAGWALLWITFAAAALARVAAHYG